MKFPAVFFVAIPLVFGCAAVQAASTKQTAASWNAVNFNHRFTDRFAAAMQIESRFKNNFSNYDVTVFKPGFYTYFNDWLYLGLGYKYQQKWQSSDEQDLWQEIYVKQPLGKVGLTHQVRLEERFINDISGVIPRLRYVLHATYPLTTKYYLSASEEIRFNLADRGTGPVVGFEQNRAYFGAGMHVAKQTRFELGYLWQYERERSSSNKSVHVLRFQVHVQTDGRKP